MLIAGIETRRAHEYLKSIFFVIFCLIAPLDTPDLILTIYEIAHHFVLSTTFTELEMSFKLLQKVLYLLQSDTIDGEKVKGILEKLGEIKKKFVSISDETLCLSYLETFRKFLLSHLEQVSPKIQEEMMLAFYTQSYEVYSFSVEKKYETLVRKSPFY